MRNPIYLLSSLQTHSTDRSYSYERLYRNLYNKELFLLAYQNIYASQGNMTQGTDGKTIDAMSLNRIDGIIASLKDESYQPQPSRRTYIPKKNGKMRPLGIPSFDDKLVQECVRLLLEAVYEGAFAKTSHGFRPNHSCHTALSQVQVCFTGVKWFVEGDIKSFFDNINHAATTQLDIDAFEAMQPYLLEEYGNASQPYSFARAPKKALRESREIIAQCIGAQPDEIFFTSGGTESNNWAIKGTAFLDPEKHGFITSAIEHHAILRPCADIERMGYPVFYLPVDSTGKVNTATLSEHIAPDTRLVSIMAANNEIGSIQDIPALAAIAHSVGAMFHTDAVQAVGHIKIDVNDLGVDMLSASAHKFHGPKGIGFLYVRKGTPLAPYASGGSQENHMRAGTENIASIVGMAAALKKCVDGLKDTAEHLTRLETKLIMGLSDANVRFSRNGSAAHIPGNISLSFPGYSGEALLHRLDLMGICVSTGSACNSRETQISHVLQAIKLEPELAKGTIRLSLGKNNTEGDIDEIVDALLRILK